MTSPAPDETTALEALATARPASGRVPMRTGSDLSVVILPGAAIDVVPPVHHRSLAFLIDVNAWGQPGIDAREALDRLRAQGWHAATITSAPDSLPAAWQAAMDEAKPMISARVHQIVAGLGEENLRYLVEEQIGPAIIAKLTGAQP